MSLPLKELLKMAICQLEEAGRADCKRDAELLYMHLFRMDRIAFIKDWATELDDSGCEAYLNLVAKRASGVPLQYIIGSTGFMGLDFAVDDRVLIPRQETELLVEDALTELSFRKKGKVLDLCCGSGAIILSLAKLAPKGGNFKWYASDISPGALAVARSNEGALGLSGVQFREGDLFGPFKKAGAFGGFDLIVSNPPYIPVEIISTLQTEVKDHEPLIALDGGEDGLDFYRRILSEAPDYLRKNGMLILEIGYDQGPELLRIAKEVGRYSNSELKQDLAGHDRILALTLDSAKFV